MTTLTIQVEAEVAEKAEEMAKAAGTTVADIFSRFVNSAGDTAAETPPEGPSIEEVIEALRAEVPQEDWDSVPTDLVDNFDHYAYGLPKKK